VVSIKATLKKKRLKISALPVRAIVVLAENQNVVMVIAKAVVAPAVTAGHRGAVMEKVSDTENPTRAIKEVLQADIAGRENPDLWEKISIRHFL
jgi:hypothetical protein